MTDRGLIHTFLHVQSSTALNTHSANQCLELRVHFKKGTLSFMILFTPLCSHRLQICTGCRSPPAALLALLETQAAGDTSLE